MKVWLVCFSDTLHDGGEYVQRALRVASSIGGALHLARKYTKKIYYDAYANGDPIYDAKKIIEEEYLPEKKEIHIKYISIDDKECTAVFSCWRRKVDK